jgi:hypothetical protein
MTKWYFIDENGHVQITYDMNSLQDVGYRRSHKDNEGNVHWRRKDNKRISSVWIQDSEVPQLILMAYLIGA